MINTTAITTLYTSLTDAISTKLEALYTADKIDAETFAKIMAQSFDDALKLSVSAVQQQEQIEKDSLVKEAQIALTTQQKTNLVAEALNIPKQGMLIDAQALHASKQAALVEKEILVKTEQVLIAKEELKVATAKLANIPKEGVVLDKQALDITAKTALTEQQKTNLVSEALNIPKQGLKIDADTAVSTQQKLNLVAEKLFTDAKVTQTSQQTTNLVAEALNIPKQGTVLVAQECKLRAEYDLIASQILRTAQENALMLQKVATEKAQTQSVGVDDNSVIGKQKALYTAQTQGFTRDAEQKAAKVMVDSWSVQRTTDETGTTANSTNMLNDVAVGRVVSRLLSGVGA